MQRILLVKTSSLGDIVHNLPVVSDIVCAHPGAHIDWVVEERFAAIPALHPAVRRVIPVAVRRWRRSWLSRATRRELCLFLRELRTERYDAVIDTQGLLKSALIARAAHGRRYGLDWSSSREPLALFYDRTSRVPRAQPAVERNRALAALALGYSPSSAVRYGITTTSRDHPWLKFSKYAVLVHATSAKDKLWPEDQWIALGTALAARSITSVLPWGTAPEHERSMRLAQAIRSSVVPPQLELDDMAGMLARAACVIGVDTGLTHLAGALDVATIGLYTTTDPARTGLYGCARAINLGGIKRTPSVNEVLLEMERLT
jgi:heptosyltransferase I